ncbi:copper resistance protein NlpE [Flavobacterium sp. LBUM151]
MKKLPIILAAFIIISCNSRKNEKLLETPLKDTETSIIEDTKSLTEVSVYEGVLPCADCSGIETVLKIYAGDGTMESHKFELIQTYKGKGEGKTFKQTGNFNYERGLDNDPNGTIYVLNWDQPESKQIFYGCFSTDLNTLHLLNNKRKTIKSDLNYVLTLKK